MSVIQIVTVFYFSLRFKYWTPKLIRPRICLGKLPSFQMVTVLLFFSVLKEYPLIAQYSLSPVSEIQPKGYVNNHIMSVVTNV